MLRRLLDRLYLGCGYLAAISLIIMLFVVVGAMVARWGGGTLSGSQNYAGYLMATSTFFALAYTLNNGAHIRVSFLLNNLGKWRRWGETWCLIISSITSVYFVYFSIKMVWVSYKLKDVSQGLDASPIWIPQVPLTIGVIVFCIALLDNTIKVIFYGELPAEGSFGQVTEVSDEETSVKLEQEEEAAEAKS